ncbi:TetR/AcrR family transcriptional regulator [Flavobacteriaceae bacterium]|nr:TetR/AcrR family transcriptional regulator [Flavobacteriaceae bacterium]
MKCRILEKATEMFITLGFKSVTMDDISKELGISKKTIYSHYKNKIALVKETTNFMFNHITCGIDEICNRKENSIVELFEIKNFVMKSLKNEQSSPMYQLQKYFPEIHAKLKQKHLAIVTKCVEENVERGIKNGMYRKDLDANFIARIYFIGINGIKDEDIFPSESYGQPKLMSSFLNYHIRAICTEKGLKILEQINNNSTLQE